MLKTKKRKWLRIRAMVETFGRAWLVETPAPGVDHSGDLLAEEYQPHQPVGHRDQPQRAVLEEHVAPDRPDHTGHRH